MFDASPGEFDFYLLTLTAPSFGRVHRVPRTSASKRRKCGCGVVHSPADVDLRGVPLDPATYDFAGQVAWNRDAGTLWDRTRRRLRDRWDSAEFFVVREWQDRGVLHFHIITRVARSDGCTREQLREAAGSAVAASLVDGTVVGWGSQIDVQKFRVSGDGARTIWYLSKALNYVMKDTARQALAGRGGRGSSRVWEHVIALELAARAARCSPGCTVVDCRSRSHERYGARGHVVSATRRTKHRIGWSFTGLTRRVQRQLRREWVARMRPPASPNPMPAAALTVPADLGRWPDHPPSGVVP